MSSKSQNARISLNISPTCHPEIDDLYEKVNQIMEVNLLADLVKKTRTPCAIHNLEWLAII